MKVFVALLRAINVGGTGKLAMSELRRLCEEAGFKDCRTYIQSGNVVFSSALTEEGVKTRLEHALTRKLGKPCAALVRTRAELAGVIRHNPYPQAPLERVLVLFLDAAPARDALADLRIPGREQVRIVGRELFVYYPDGMGKSKLRLPFAQVGTGRNLNTVTKLVALAAELEQN